MDDEESGELSGKTQVQRADIPTKKREGKTREVATNPNQIELRDRTIKRSQEKQGTTLFFYFVR
jgi:hypothetical protein